jgi:hypothetical protein
MRRVLVPTLLVSSYAAVFGTFFAAAGSEAAVRVAAVGWAGTLACVAAARRAWPDEPLVRTVGFWLGGAAISVFVLYAGWLFSYGVQISAELCGEGGSAAVALGVGAIVYAAAGAALAPNARSLLWAWPVAVVAGLAVRVVLLALLPGAHGFCET